MTGGGGQTFFGFVKGCLVYLGYAMWSIISTFLGLLMRKFDKASARLSFSPKYCRLATKNAIKPLVFTYHEAMGIFWGLQVS